MEREGIEFLGYPEKRLCHSDTTCPWCQVLFLCIGVGGASLEDGTGQVDG